MRYVNEIDNVQVFEIVGSLKIFCVYILFFGKMYYMSEDV